MALVDRAKNMITSPKTEWAVVASEEPNQGAMVTGYALPLILLGAVAAFIGYGIIGYGPFSSMSWGLYHATLLLINGLLTVFITPLVVNALAPSFNSQKDQGRATQLVVYSMTPAWIAGALNILPSLGVLLVLVMVAGAIYTLYLIYLGLPHTMKTPADKVAVYMVVTIVCLIVIYAVIGAVLSPILSKIFNVYWVTDVNFRM